MNKFIRAVVFVSTSGITFGICSVAAPRLPIATQGKIVVAVKKDDTVSMLDKDLGSRHYAVASTLKSDFFWSKYATKRMLAAKLDPSEIRIFTKISTEPLLRHSQRTVTLTVYLYRGGKDAFEALAQSYSDYCTAQKLIRDDMIERLPLADKALASSLQLNFPVVESAQLAAHARKWR